MHVSCMHVLTGQTPMQVSIPLWSLVHLPVIVTVTTAAFTEKVLNYNHP